MTEKAFVVFVYIITDNGFLPFRIIPDGSFKAFYNLFQYGIIENKFLPVHNGLYIRLGQQFSGLQNDTVGSRIKNIHP